MNTDKGSKARIYTKEACRKSPTCTWKAGRGRRQAAIKFTEKKNQENRVGLPGTSGGTDHGTIVVLRDGSKFSAVGLPKPGRGQVLAPYEERGSESDGPIRMGISKPVKITEDMGTRAVDIMEAFGLHCERVRRRRL